MSLESAISQEDHFPGSRFVRKYIAWIVFLMVLVVFAAFWGFHGKAMAMLHEQILAQGRSFSREILLTREWLAIHNGVYVPMTPGMEVNPWLQKVPGVKIVIHDREGVPYTLKNPALITREISGIAEKRGLFRFRITSLNPLNPSNTPDPFERDSLEKFAKGEKETERYETGNGGISFRYMVPLVTEKACLRCHEAQGYKEGEIRGGISVSTDAAPMIRQMKTYRAYLAGSAFAIVALFLSVTLYISRFLVKDLEKAERRLMEMATRDHLTGLMNRREGLRKAGEERARAHRTGNRLFAMMIDIDHFKKINDVHGHAVGDTVLGEVALRMRAGLREYDILCRYGGEEFLVFSPESGLPQAVAVAERLRASVGKDPIRLGGSNALTVTVSIGVSELSGEETIDSLISRADAALYSAKQGGRNRVCG
jgi:diguanylate cyclase (GGDEF)-like protein